MDAGNNTEMGVVVNEPGSSTPLQRDIVQEGLEQTIQEDAQSEISSLTLGIANAPTVSEEQRDDAISVRLTNSQASEVRYFVCGKRKTSKHKIFFSEKVFLIITSNYTIICPPYCCTC